jgi:hypothetical protein
MLQSPLLIKEGEKKNSPQLSPFLPTFLPSFVSFSQQITHKGKHTRELQQVEQQTTTRETLIRFLARTSGNKIEADICTESSVARTLSFQGVRPIITGHVYN